MTPSQKFGLWLMGVGARLAFQTRTNESFDALKNAINRETDFGSQVDSGGHIQSTVQPIARYTAISVVNVLCKPEMITENVKVSRPDEKMPEYLEHWGEPKEK